MGQIIYLKVLKLILMGQVQSLVSQGGQKKGESQKTNQTEIKKSKQNSQDIVKNKFIQNEKQVIDNKVIQSDKSNQKISQSIDKCINNSIQKKGQKLQNMEQKCTQQHSHFQNYQSKMDISQKQFAKEITESQTSNQTEGITLQHSFPKVQCFIPSYQTQYQLVKKIDEHRQIVSNITYHQQTQTLKFNYFYKLNGKILNLLKIKPQQSYLLIQELEIKCPQYLPYLLYEIIFKDVATQSQLQYSQQKQLLYKKVLKQYKKKQFGEEKCEVPLILLKHFIQSSSRKLYFQQKQDMRTTLSMKNIFTGFMSQYYVFRQKFQENDIYRFQTIVNPSQRKLLDMYIYELKLKLATKYDTKIQQIFVFQLKKGSIDAQFATKKQLYQLFKFKNATFAQLFSKYRLSERNFDHSRNTRFEQWINQQDLFQRRGSFPYYPPVHCKRYALNVSKRYQNDIWLSHEAKKLGVWAVGMHGSFIHTKISPIQNIIQSMMSGFETSHMLKIGQRHVYQDLQNCRGKKNQKDAEHVWQKIGKGIYLTPYYEMALKYGSYNSKTQSKINQKFNKQQQDKIYWGFNIVIQARIHPKYIKIPKQRDNHNVWVVPQSRFIRPYGILVSLDEDYEKQLNYLCNQDVNYNKNNQRRYIGVRYKKQKKINQEGQVIESNPYEFNYYLMREQIQKYCQASFSNE